MHVRQPQRGLRVQLFTIFFSRPIEFGAAATISIVMLLILLGAARTAEGPSRLAGR